MTDDTLVKAVMDCAARILHVLDEDRISTRVGVLAMFGILEEIAENEPTVRPLVAQLNRTYGMQLRPKLEIN